VLSQVDEKNALRILEDLCLMPLGGVVSPISGYGMNNEKMARVTLEPKKGASITRDVRFNEIAILPLAANEEAELTVSGHWKLNYGNGFWKSLSKTVTGGEVGILVDMRGRELRWEKKLSQQRKQSQAWLAQWMQGGDRV
jgi:hypothetical protein